MSGMCRCLMDCWRMNSSKTANGGLFYVVREWTENTRLDVESCVDFTCLIPTSPTKINNFQHHYAEMAEGCRLQSNLEVVSQQCSWLEAR